MAHGFSIRQHIAYSPCGHMRRVVTTAQQDDPRGQAGEQVDLDGDQVTVLERFNVINEHGERALALTVASDAGFPDSGEVLQHFPKC